MHFFTLNQPSPSLTLLLTTITNNATVPAFIFLLQPYSFPSHAPQKSTHSPIYLTGVRVFQIPADRARCFTYDLRRQHPVANLTDVREAHIFELFAPGMIFTFKYMSS